MTKRNKIRIHFSSTNDTRRINEELAARRGSLASELFGTVPIRRMPNGDLRVHNRGSLNIKQDRFYSFEDEDGGDFIKLIVVALECDFREAIEYAADFIARTAPDNFSVMDAVRGDGWNPEKSKALAESLWKNGEDNIRFFLRYLRQRDIETPADTALRKLRYLPRLKYDETGEYFPCGLVKLQHGDGGFAGVQRIYLSHNCQKKAPVASPKMALGHAHGAAMRLSPPASELFITEGLEEALTLMQMHPGIAVWGYVGSGIMGCTFPPVVKKIVIATDADKAGERYRQKLSRRLIAEGYRVGFLIPSGAKDFNEMLQKGKTL